MFFFSPEELTSEMEEEIDWALSANPSEEILTEHFKIQIKRRDMTTLAGLNWLNDEVLYEGAVLQRRRQQRNKWCS